MNDNAVKNPDYIVVTETLLGLSKGVFTWNSFPNEAAFHAWYNETMLDGSNRPLSEIYSVVARGITREHVEAIINLAMSDQALRVASMSEAVGLMTEASVIVDYMLSPV